MTSTRVRIGLVLTACAALVVACSSSEQSIGNGQSPPKMEPLSAVGNGDAMVTPSGAGIHEVDVKVA